MASIFQSSSAARAVPAKLRHSRTTRPIFLAVTPAKAGVQGNRRAVATLDPSPDLIRGFRRDDEREGRMKPAIGCTLPRSGKQRPCLQRRAQMPGGEFVLAIAELLALRPLARGGREDQLEDPLAHLLDAGRAVK